MQSPQDRDKGKGGISGSLASKEPEVGEVLLHYGGSQLRVVSLGQLWGGGESLGEVAGGDLGADRRFWNAEQGLSSFPPVCPQHLLLEEMDEMGNWPPPE